jgi:putative endonuclease
MREKQIKRWRRQWKFDLIEKMNPEWEDLYLLLNR